MRGASLSIAELLAPILFRSCASAGTPTAGRIDASRGEAMSHAFEVDWQGAKEEGPVFRAGREFGVNEAAELRERLTELGPRVPVRVDLTRTVDLSDHALAELLEWVVDRHRGPVAFVGLNAHHERMLRYLVPRAAQALPL
jgi:hypothetical protein